MATLRQLCRDPTQRLITILGPGGIGKTRLAIKVATQLIDDLPHGVFLVRLAQLGDPAHIVPAIADALNFHFHADGRSAQQLPSGYLLKKVNTSMQSGYWRSPCATRQCLKVGWESCLKSSRCTTSC